MTSYRFALVALALVACSSKNDHPPLATTGTNVPGTAGAGGGSGGGVTDGGAADAQALTDATTEGGPCSTTTCPGCCDINNVCQPGTSDLACGLGGNTCIPCSQSGTTCVASDAGGYFCQ